MHGLPAYENALDVDTVFRYLVPDQYKAGLRKTAAAAGLGGISIDVSGTVLVGHSFPYVRATRIPSHSPRRPCLSVQSGHVRPAAKLLTNTNGPPTLQPESPSHGYALFLRPPLSARRGHGRLLLQRGKLPCHMDRPFRRPRGTVDPRADDDDGHRHRIRIRISIQCPYGVRPRLATRTRPAPLHQSSSSSSLSSSMATSLSSSSSSRGRFCPLLSSAAVAGGSGDDGSAAGAPLGNFGGNPCAVDDAAGVAPPAFGCGALKMLCWSSVTSTAAAPDALDLNVPSSLEMTCDLPFA